jgi:hypothetical protein
VGDEVAVTLSTQQCDVTRDPRVKPVNFGLTILRDTSLRDDSWLSAGCFLLKLSSPSAPLKLTTEIKWAGNQEAVTFLG